VEARDVLVATAAYQPEPTAAAAARRFVRDTLQTWLVGGSAADGYELVDDAVLLTSELVTNAVVHAGTQVEVTCKLTDGGVEVVVSDGHPTRLVPEPPENEHIPAERTSGRGLLLPAALASAWGVTYGQSAKAVWFRLGQGPGQELAPDQGAGRSDGLPAVPASDFRVAPARGLDGQATMADALRRAPVAAGSRAHRWSAPPFEEPGCDELLASTVEAALAAVGADAAYAMVPDEDGELRLRAAIGSFPVAGAAGQGQAGARPAGMGQAGSGQAGRVRRGGRAQQAGRLRKASPASRAAQVRTGPPSLAAVRVAASTAPSVLTVPFVVDGRVTGLLAVSSATPDRFHDDEAIRLQQLADRWGPPLERARLGELERVRRGRIGLLTQARELLAGRVDTNEVLALAGEAAVPRLAPWCAVLLPSGDMGLRVVYARHMDEERSTALAWLLDRASEMAAGADPPPRAARLGPVWRWPLAVPGLAQAPSGADALATETAWCFPLGPGTGVGVFAVGHRRDELLPRGVAELAADLASRIGMALESARLVSPQP
jgi:anti-sigma regulatory factor (Ser/Thr protein kinase)/GAF domain-containing protein